MFRGFCSHECLHVGGQHLRLYRTTAVFDAAFIRLWRDRSRAACPVVSAISLQGLPTVWRREIGAPAMLPICLDQCWASCHECDDATSEMLLLFGVMLLAFTLNLRSLSAIEERSALAGIFAVAVNLHNMKHVACMRRR